MSSGAERRGPGDSPRIRLLEQLRERLERAALVGGELRAGLRQADAAAIDEARSRLETLALELRLLDTEYRRLPEAAEFTPEERERLVRARSSLREAATRLARSAAVGGGLLERLVNLGRRLSETAEAARGEIYLPTGRTRVQAVEGLRLKERA